MYVSTGVGWQAREFSLSPLNLAVVQGCLHPIYAENVMDGPPSMYKC